MIITLKQKRGGQEMAIYREVRTEVYCDICGERIVAFKSAENGVSRGWAAYFAQIGRASCRERVSS